MDIQSEKTLARIIRGGRVAALGTIHDGEPRLSMVAYVFSADFSVVYVHVSKLSQHTMDMQKNNRVSLLIIETDDGVRDPHSLARISLRGNVELFPNGTPGYNLAKSLYIHRFPQSEALFSSIDFNLWRITPKGGRYVAGAAKAFNVVPETLQKVSAVEAD